MIHIRWTTAAAEDLYSITRYIRRDNPEAARNVAKIIYNGCEGLVTAPYRGRKGVDREQESLSSLPCLTLLSTEWQTPLSRFFVSGTPRSSDSSPRALLASRIERIVVRTNRMKASPR